MNKEQDKEFNKEFSIADFTWKDDKFARKSKRKVKQFISKIRQQDRDKYIRELEGLKRRLYPEELDNPFYPKEGKKKMEMGANKVHNEIAKEINAEISKLIKKYV